MTTFLINTFTLYTGRLKVIHFPKIPSYGRNGHRATLGLFLPALYQKGVDIEGNQKKSALTYCRESKVPKKMKHC